MKSLLVFDQVRPASLRAALDPAVGADVHELCLDYIPRTTPVGHATISTGQIPSVHRIQGRSWYAASGLTQHLHHVEDVLSSAPGPVFDVIERANLARRLRNAGSRGIVIAAAKSFIPFLFGAWHSDVCVYPDTVRPIVYATGTTARTVAMDLCFITWSDSGHAALVAAWHDITVRLTRLAALVPQTAMSAPAPPQTAPSLPHRHLARWIFHWPAVDQLIARLWAPILGPIADEIDAFYTDVSLEILRRMAEPVVLLQSCFSTDYQGHMHGPSSTQYSNALRRSVSRAQQLHGYGPVVVTSDHGGRDTPLCWRYDANARTLDVGAALSFTLPTARIVADADHLVGYDHLSLGPQPVELLRVTPNALVPMIVPPRILQRSHHRAQVPRWLVLPSHDARITDRAIRPGGGDHGACEDHGVLSDDDNRVPLWLLHAAPATVSNYPRNLEDLAAWFVQLS
ncbi:MAG TPA: alkaline phosphatase family protein [Kofleriaceae bacterium]|nr:alkaline phosphatase family protein [Kofleriaceae bacterium]